MARLLRTFALLLVLALHRSLAQSPAFDRRAMNAARSSIHVLLDKAFVSVDFTRRAVGSGHLDVGDSAEVRLFLWHQLLAARVGHQLDMIYVGGGDGLFAGYFKCPWSSGTEGSACGPATYTYRSPGRAEPCVGCLLLLPLWWW